LASLNNNIDYKSDFVILKDGIGNIKIWLNKSDKFKDSVIKFKTVIDEKN